MTNFFHVIKDPVHGTMQFTSTEDAWVKPFIDSPNFQRLRHIKQMGMGDYVFPGAVHTRFNHSLGCAYVACQIAHKIGLVESERQLVMTACLLHDIGHGPFSHAFEGVFHNKAILHEDWTPYFLAEYGNEAFFNNYNRVNPRFCLTEEKFRSIADMIMHKTATKSVLADIVSSQLDADRLDYLLRDSHFCGARYGEFDFRWMLHCMAIVDSGNGERLGITHKGIGTVEHYLMARRLMVKNIYQSQKKLAIEALLIQLLASLAVSLEYYAPFADIRQTLLGQFLLAANRFNQLIENKQNFQLDKQDFLLHNYNKYKELCDYDVFALIKYLAQLDDEQPVIKIAKRLHYRQMPKIIRIEQIDIDKFKQSLKEFKATHKQTIEEWQLMLIETPHQSYTRVEDPILVVNERGVVKPISHYSITINAISDRLEHFVCLCIDHEILGNQDVQKFIKHLQNACEALPG